MDKVKEIVNKILSEIGQWIHPVPIRRVVEIVQSWWYDISLHWYNFPDEQNISWCVKNVGGKYHIILNETMSSKRQIFTFAHELGHIVMGHFNDNNTHIDTLYRDWWSYNHKQESEANNFAWMLLMPEEDIKIEYAKTWSIEMVSDKFAVSEDAVRIRLIKLNILK
jgi:hypothetical protein